MSEDNRRDEILDLTLRIACLVRIVQAENTPGKEVAVLSSRTQRELNIFQSIGNRLKSEHFIDKGRYGKK